MPDPDMDQTTPDADSSGAMDGYRPLDGSVDLTPPLSSPIASPPGASDGPGYTWRPLTDPALDQHYAGLASQYDPYPQAGVLGTFQQLPPDGIADRWRHTSPTIPGEQPMQDVDGNPCWSWLVSRPNGQNVQAQPYFGLPSSTASGNVVLLPDQTKIPDAKSPTGYLMSPNANASEIASAGKQTGSIYRDMMNSPDPNTREAAYGNMIGSIVLI